MNLFAMMETSGTAMQAERMRAEVVAANMANAETTSTASGGAYHRQHVVFAANNGDPEFADTLNEATEAETATNAALPLNLTSSGVAAPGVHIAAVVEDTTPPRKRFDPGNPDAGPDGYVSYPDINPLTEIVDLMGATRAYGMNSSAVQAEKSMIVSALDITKS
jgi:flagellar basal-body rod protein FlgC